MIVGVSGLGWAFIVFGVLLGVAAVILAMSAIHSYPKLRRAFGIPDNRH